MESIGGYRLVRRLGVGSRAQVFLGHGGGNVEPVAVKVYRPHVPVAGISAEIAVLAAADSPHLLPLLDLATDPARRPALILPVLGQPLAGLLAGGRVMAAGEVVTICAPLIRAVAGLHAGGAVHGGIRASRVLFTEDGAPVLTGFGSARVGAVRNEQSGALADVAALESLVRILMQSTPPAEQGATERLEEWRNRWRLSGQPDGNRPRWSPRQLEELEEFLYSWADPLPVSFNETQSRAEPGLLRFGGTMPADPVEDTGLENTRTDHAVLDGSGTRDAPRPDAPDEERGELLRRVLAFVDAFVPGLVDRDLQHRLPEFVGGLLERLRAAVRSVRPRFRLLALAAVLAVAGMVVVSIATTGEDRASASGPPNLVQVQPDLPPEQPAPLDAAPDLGEESDPAAAAAGLLRLREECFRLRSVLCLDDLYQRDSAGWAADAERIRNLQTGAEEAPGDRLSLHVPRLVELLGGVAIVALDPPVDDGAAADAGAQRDPASVLVVRSEAGWRLREILRG